MQKPCDDGMPNTKTSISENSRLIAQRDSPVGGCKWAIGPPWTCYFWGRLARRKPLSNHTLRDVAGVSGPRVRGASGDRFSEPRPKRSRVHVPSTFLVLSRPCEN